MRKVRSKLSVNSSGSMQGFRILSVPLWVADVHSTALRDRAPAPVCSNGK